MILQEREPQRSGATAVEMAVVLPVAFLILFGLIIGGVGVFRYHQVAAVAREGARWASVHGRQYEFASGNSLVTESDVFTQAMQPKATNMDPSKLTYSVTWSPDNRQGSTVIVTVNYLWTPGAYFPEMTLTSTSKMPVSY